MIDWIYKTQPFKHQHDIFMESRDKEFYALLMEMGTGKTFVTLNTGSWLYAQGNIDAILVICPNGLQRVWADQTLDHVPDYVNAKAAWHSATPTRKESSCLESVLRHEKGLKVVAINVESLTTSRGLTFIKWFLMTYRTLLVVDESSTIKNPKAIRTKKLLELAIHAKYRRILTGTPVTQGPLDLFTQFRFLDSHILHCGSPEI